MPRPLSAATAEQVAAVVEAVVGYGAASEKQAVAQFTDIPEDRAAAALDLACELGLLVKAGTQYGVAHPIARLLRTPHVNEKAAVLRVVLEQFEPFIVFRQELDSTGDVSQAAVRTRARLDLIPHREDIKSTLLGLATFSGALIASSGGRYERDIQGIAKSLNELASGSSEKAAAFLQVRQLLSVQIANELSAENVVDPLADALRHASAGAAREAVVFAGNAVESFVSDIAPGLGVNIANAHGLNAKLDRFDAVSALPKKMIFNGKYLGHIRNAADHGVDPDVNAAWAISEQTGLNYVFVALSFIVAVRRRMVGAAEI